MYLLTCWPTLQIHTGASIITQHQHEASNLPQQISTNMNSIRMRDMRSDNGLTQSLMATLFTFQSRDHYHSYGFIITHKS